MPFRFRRYFKIGPGIKLNLSKGGLSTSLGVPGAHLNLGKRGPRVTVGIPGSGLSYSEQIGRSHRSFSPPAADLGPSAFLADAVADDGPGIPTISAPPPRRAPWKVIGIVFGSLCAICAACTGFSAIVSPFLPTHTPTARAALPSPLAVATATPRPTATRPFPTMASLPTAAPLLQAVQSPLPTVSRTPLPTLVSYPTNVKGGGSTGGCCKHCGSNSQPCGDTCISLTYTCRKSGGCACP